MKQSTDDARCGASDDLCVEAASRRPGAHYDRPDAGQSTARGEFVNLETALNEIVELARAELHIVRKRAEEKTPARDHGRDYHAAQEAADRLDQYAHQLYRLHDAEYGEGWRHHSAGDRN